MKLQFIASVAAVLLNSGHGVFAAKDEPKGLRGSIEFLKYQKSPEGKCYDQCCDYAGEDQVLLEYQRNCNSNECEGVYSSYGGKGQFCRDYDGGEGGGGGGWGGGGGGGFPGMPGSPGGPPPNRGFNGGGGGYGGFPGEPGSPGGPPANPGYRGGYGGPGGFPGAPGGFPGRGGGYAPYYEEESE